MKNKKEINVFIENDYESFVFPQDIKLEDLTKQVVSMVGFFLNQQNWIEKSCLKNYDYNLLYFDVVLTNNEKIKEINSEYRQKDSATDVITFAIFADSPDDERFVFDNEINLGEIIVSLDKAYEQAISNCHHNQKFEDELLFLFAHGILHLLGFDHQDEATLMEMWAMQQEMIENCK